MAIGHRRVYQDMALLVTFSVGTGGPCSNEPWQDETLYS
jgi:hypothetical protein